MCVYPISHENILKQNHEIFTNTFTIFQSFLQIGPLCSPGSAVAVGHAGPCSRAGTLEFLSVSALGHPVLSKRFQPSAARRRMVPLKKCFFFVLPVHGKKT